MYKDLSCTFRASCYSARLSWALVVTWVSPFVQNKNVGEENRFSRYDIRAVGALPPSVNVSFNVFLLGELIPKYKYVRFELFFMKVIVALILMDVSEN